MKANEVVLTGDLLIRHKIIFQKKWSKSIFMRNLREIITLISFKAEDSEGVMIWVVECKGLYSYKLYQHTLHFPAFYEYVFQQNIKWCEKNFRENILYLKSLKRFGKQSIIGERIVLRFKGREWEGEDEWILLLLWRKSSMSKCLVSRKETRFQLSHPIAWKEDVTNSLIQNRIQVGK